MKKKNYKKHLPNTRYKNLLSGSYKSKSNNDLLKELTKKGLVKSYLKKSGIKSNNLKNDPGKYKSLRTFAKSAGIRLTKTSGVTLSKISPNTLKLKTNTQIFFQYKNKRGETRIISQLILSDDKRYQKRKLQNLLKILLKYDKNILKKVFIKKLK